MIFTRKTIFDSLIQIFTFSVRPVPTVAAAPISTQVRLTFHTTSLPKPQFAVPVSLSDLPPFKVSNNNVNLSQQKNLMDTKGAKHAANINKKGSFAKRLVF